MNENLRRAVETLEAGAAEVRELSTRSIEAAWASLRRTLDDAETHLESEDCLPPPETDTMGRLDRQSRDIAEELRRVERLMRRRGGL